ncbi:MAG TPA: DUF456 domain-containing protein [Longimicrobiales bacterium]|nr:DUF456 domain-containing protein [Longimicrobiales bacterium]
MEWLGIALMIIALLSIPLGLPGLWVMIGVLAVGAISGTVGVLVLLACTVIAIIGELIEYAIVGRMTKQYGGSRKAFWGALAGGFAGILVGLPVPIIGSVIAGMLGAFIGSALVTYAETKELRSAHRVGWGVVLGRAFSAVAKTGAGLAILVIGSAALLR